MTTSRALEQAYARVFAGPEGEEVFADLMRQGRYDQPCFTTEPLGLAHNEGRRSMALYVRAMVERGRADPAAARSALTAGRTGC